MRQRTIEPVFRGLEHCGGRPEQRFRPLGGVNRRRKIASEEVRLQLARPIVELGERQIGAASQTTFGFELTVVFMIQAPERLGQATQRQDQAELCSTELDHQSETHPPGECEAVLAFGLHFGEWVPRRETNRD